ncbi:MAG: class IV adenylate cyclase [Candidatus Aminicenantales bacterium]|jgi:adenylate cyclase class 2
MVEIEVKIRVQDPKTVRDKLLALGAAVTTDRVLEENILYDFPAGTLKSGRRALRLRRAGKRASLTFKGSPRKSRSFKVREEFETGVSDSGQVRKILRALGLQPAFSYRKHRTMFRKGRLAICLDETPVGAFLELEGERHEITRFARALGFGRPDFIQADYIELMEREKGKPKEEESPEGD